MCNESMSSYWYHVVPADVHSPLAPHPFSPPFQPTKTQSRTGWGNNSQEDIQVAANGAHRDALARANSVSNDRAWRPAPPTQCGHQLNIKSITDSYLGCHSSSCHCRVASADISVPIWLGLLHWPFPQAQPGPCPVYPSSVVCPRAALTWVCQPCWCLPGHSTTALHTPKPPTLTGSTPHPPTPNPAGPLTALLLSWGNPCASMATISNSEEDPCKERQPGQDSPGNGSPGCPPHKERDHQEYSRGADPSFQVYPCF